MISARRRGRPWTLVKLGGLGLVGTLVSCSQPQPGPMTFTGTTVRSVSQDTFLTHARSLQYDTAWGAGDRARLVRIDSGYTCPDPAHCRVGPLVVLQAVRGANNQGHSALVQGRVVARIIHVDPTDTIGYRKYNLGARDTVYWWMDSTSSAGWRSVFVSSRPDVPLRADSGAKHGEENYPRSAGHPYWNLAIARWLWSDRDQNAWVSCEKHGCCATDGT